MKYEIDARRPESFRPSYPEEFDLFSHLELTAAIPQALFAVTTWKGNGMPNVCPHAWSCFHGGPTAFFAVLGNLYQTTHTYENLRREGAFCVNFLSLRHYDGLMRTIRHNGDGEDEFQTGGFTLEEGRHVHAPRIGESFLVLECRLDSLRDLSGAGLAAMAVGRVLGAAVEEAYVRDLTLRHGPEGFPLLFPGPQDLATGAPSPTGLATLEIRRYD